MQIGGETRVVAPVVHPGVGDGEAGSDTHLAALTPTPRQTDVEARVVEIQQPETRRRQGSVVVKDIKGFVVKSFGIIGDWGLFVSVKDERDTDSFCLTYFILYCTVLHNISPSCNLW